MTTQESSHPSRTARSPKSSHPSRPTHAPHSPSRSAASYTLITEPDQGLTAIYKLISSAKHSIDITIYELTDTAVTAMLAKAAAAGIAVRVILDQNEKKQSNTAAYDALAAAKVGVHWANPAYTVTHQKTITVDQVTSAIMTLNLVPGDYPATRDFAVITNNAADVAAIETTFDADFKNAGITPPIGENLVWSPTNARSSLLSLINGAKKSLLLSQEEFSDTGMQNALVAALKRGVAVTLVQENPQNKYSATLTALKNAGAKIAVYTSTASKSYYIHAKTILADYGTAQARLFLGSENFSTDSLDKNRELGLLFSDAACIAGVYAAITKDFKSGTRF